MSASVTRRRSRAGARLPWEGPAPSGVDTNAAWRGSTPAVYWESTVASVDPAPTLQGDETTDLLIIGGGFTGLWAALRAKELDPERDVTLIEAGRCGDGGSGRNGGFCFSSLTHTPENGLARFPHEIETIERLGLANHRELLADVERYDIACDLERVGFLHVAVDVRQTEEFAAKAALLRRLGHHADQLDAEATRAEVASPIYEGAVLQHTGIAALNPLKLVHGLRQAAQRAGVRVHEHTRAERVEDLRTGLRVTTPGGRVAARGVVLGTNAFPPLVRKLKHYVVPVYDYVLVTQQLTKEQLALVRWHNRQPIEDAGNRFHYYRLTPDNRILWGGYGAAYGGGFDPAMEGRADMFARLAHNFFINFPQLADVSFEYRWAGAIDTCSRFSVFFGSAHGGKLTYATGYTGLGVGAARFGGRIALDLLDGRASDASRLTFVKKHPVPFPPEPLRGGLIRFTMNRMAAADRAGGKPGVWLRTLERLRLGFQS